MLMVSSAAAAAPAIVMAAQRGPSENRQMTTDFAHSFLPEYDFHQRLDAMGNNC